jgi:hypothetical protein
MKDMVRKIFLPSRASISFSIYKEAKIKLNYDLNGKSGFCCGDYDMAVFWGVEAYRLIETGTRQVSEVLTASVTNSLRRDDGGRKHV